MRRTFFLVFAVLLLFPFRSTASSFTQMVVFGDSLSDTGNLYIATGGTPAPPGYSSGLFTDGPNSYPSTTSPLGVWDQQLSGMLGLPSPTPYLTGGTNYAYGGALTETPTGSNIPGVVQQVGIYLGSHTPSSSALYTVWAGANDLFASPTALTAQTAVSNLQSSINALYAAGARNFLWLNMPPLGSTPDFLNNTVYSTIFNNVSQLYNADWRQAISSLYKTDPGIRITGVNIYGLDESILADPAAYGFTDVTDPAQGLSGVNPNEYAFWDGVHPTTEGHYWIARTAYQDLVPEPPTVLLFGICLLAAVLWMGLVSRKRSFLCNMRRSGKGVA